jgi:hypothetical protein
MQRRKDIFYTEVTDMAGARSLRVWRNTFFLRIQELQDVRRKTFSGEAWFP